MTEGGYNQSTDFPHEFVRDNLRIGFEPEEELKNFANLDISDLKTTEFNGVKFKELRKEDYLSVYTATLNNWEEKIKKHKAKIEALNKIVGI